MILFFGGLAVHVLGVPLQAVIPGQVVAYAPNVVFAALTAMVGVLIALMVGITIAALGLAFGLGARADVGNLIAARRLARALEVGQRIRVGELTGRVVQLTETAGSIEVPEGLARVPASLFDAEPFVVLGSDE